MVTSDFDAAARLAVHTGKRVGGTFTPTGEPVYFLHAEDLTEREAHAISFELRRGRPQTSYDRWLASMAQKRREAVTA